MAPKQARRGWFSKMLVRRLGWFDSLAMPQTQLPIFPQGTTLITPELAFERRGEQVVYFNGHLPVFTHEASDLATFRFFSCQLIVNGTATQGQIVRAFGVPLRTVKRYMKKFREGGAKVFFSPPAKRQGHRLTAQRLVEVQEMLDGGMSVPAISSVTGVLATTLHKAIDGGRLRQNKKKAMRATAQRTVS